MFLSLAEIAGIFVGFGALIALRSGATADPAEVTFVGMVVWMGVQVVAGALAPVAISRFGVTDHALWVACSVIVLVLFWVVRRGGEAALPGAPGRSWPPCPERFARARSSWACRSGSPMTLALVLVGARGAFPTTRRRSTSRRWSSCLLFTAATVLLLVITGASAWKAPVSDGSGGPR